MAQKHFGSVFGQQQHKKSKKKSKLKFMIKMQKITKESKLSLGSWLAFWAANDTMHLDARFKL